MKYQNIDLFDAARRTIDVLTAIGGEGGLIAVDAHGHITMPFNSDGMYRGFKSGANNFEIHIYR